MGTPYARKIRSPQECYGTNFEVFNQLKSPEWQLCEVGDTLHMCTSDSPGVIPIRLKTTDGVREDSFMIDIRRKSTFLHTNFFQANVTATEEDLDRDLIYYDQHCPIEKSYQGASSCSGGYNNGAGQFYPPFSFAACQCEGMNIVAAEDGTDGDTPPVYYASMLNETRSDITDAGGNEVDYMSSKGTLSFQGNTPCFFEIRNNQTRTSNKPYLWNKMNSYKLHVRIDEIPEDGSVMLIGSFQPSFWMNQRPDKLVTWTVTYQDLMDKQANGEYLSTEFKSTYNVYALTDNPKQLASNFKFTYYIVDTTIPVDPSENTNYSLWITISVGIPIMLISLCFFEGKNIV